MMSFSYLRAVNCPPRQMMKLHQNNSKNNSNGHFINGHQRSSSSGASCVNVVPVSKINDVISTNNISTNNIKDELESTNGSTTLSSTFLVPGESNPTSTHHVSSSNTSQNDYNKGNLLVNGFIDHENQGTAAEPQLPERVHQQLLTTVTTNHNKGNHDSRNNPNAQRNLNADSNSSKKPDDPNKDFEKDLESKYDSSSVEMEAEASQRSDSPIQIEQDMFGLYSLCMVNKMASKASLMLFIKGSTEDMINLATSLRGSG